MTTPGASAQPSIEVTGLYKKYRSHTVLEDVNLTVSPGEVYALTGPNGAGKTTLIRTITGLAFPTRGEVQLLGRSVHKEGIHARAYLGAVVEAPARFYGQFTGTHNLMIHARLAGMAPGVQPITRARVREVLALLELTRMADRRVSEFSLGQRQRLGVASAILAEPKVLILDEPTSGLDPLGIGLIHRIVTNMAASGCAVILSTHHLREIATYAHTVGILTGGRLVDSVDLRARQSAYRFRVDDPVAAAAILDRLPFVKKTSTRTPYAIAYLDSESRVPETLTHLSSLGIRVLEASPDLFDLYEYYRERVELP
ncbi:ABC transporter ATP-binding protein [Deinococcus deserti]|uniref:Putative ABC transporter, ATP-binding component n=1 Tax=Deinococcus deserti (strain DSM 17065 / CIP 109153 / LMG 22923 / VCD115) TaxID=546414 RepID=C1CX30_DEIDV|nr:ABC transporter ATP-binding protein [Deinococcus deserti]ACO46747.1 putative ABC transporter, ATP-binding component [Deinococcus deserti VCD115]